MQLEDLCSLGITACSNATRDVNCHFNFFSLSVEVIATPGPFELALFKSFGSKSSHLEDVLLGLPGHSLFCFVSFLLRNTHSTYFINLPLPFFLCVQVAYMYLHLFYPCNSPVKLGRPQNSETTLRSKQLALLAEHGAMSPKLRGVRLHC